MPAVHRSAKRHDRLAVRTQEEVVRPPLLVRDGLPVLIPAGEADGLVAGLVGESGSDGSSSENARRGDRETRHVDAAVKVDQNSINLTGVDVLDGNLPAERHSLPPPVVEVAM